MLHDHHHGEDVAIWPRLLQRCPDEILPLVHAMESHHERIAVLGSELTKHTAAWRTDGSLIHREAVLHTLGELLPVLREHLEVEERYVLPTERIYGTRTPPSGCAKVGEEPMTPRVS